MRKIDLQKVLEQADLSTKGLPPVHLWNPQESGDIDIRIDVNGTWYHEGDEIKRQELAKLFSTILKFENGDYFLVTPVEKYRIQVEEKPFVIVAVVVRNRDATNQSILAIDNFGDSVEIGEEHALWVEQTAAGEPRPYVHIRNGLDALVSRNVFYELVNDYAQEFPDDEGGSQLIIRSCGEQFSLGAI